MIEGKQIFSLNPRPRPCQEAVANHGKTPSSFREVLSARSASLLNGRAFLSGGNEGKEKRERGKQGKRRVGKGIEGKEVRSSFSMDRRGRYKGNDMRGRVRVKN